MSEVTHADLRAHLEQERNRVREQLAQYGYGDEESLSFDEGFADSGQVTAERSEVEALVRQLVEVLQEVERALAKLDDGSYGKCEVCGAEIPTPRLEAKPAARYCIECASRKR